MKRTIIKRDHGTDVNALRCRCVYVVLVGNEPVELSQRSSAVPMSYTPCSPLKGAKSIDSEEILVTAWRDGEKSSDQDSLTYLEAYEKVGDSMRDRSRTDRR